MDVLTLAELWCIIEGTEFTDERIDEFPLLFEKEEREWAYILPDKFIVRSAKLDNSQIAQAVQQWIKEEEMQGITFASAREFVAKLCDFCQKATKEQRT
jgi:hypothetical protein